jgi:tetratricopeptide (TPR) repeat protein
MATVATLTASEEAQLQQTIEMFEVITQSQPQDYQSLEILKEAYQKLGRDKDVANTSKRIAQAYVMMGQLSSAILEYESVLQRCPDDAEVLAALSEIENKANTLNSQAAPSDSGDNNTKILTKSTAARARSAEPKGPACEIDDGRQTLHKLFVDSKVISAGDFDLCWVKPDMSATPGKVYEPFIQLLADKGVLPLEKSLKIIADKHRCGYLPLERYDIDVELARSMPAATLQRWCVLPFDRMSKSILVATANPFNKRAAQELEESVQQRLVWYLTSPQDLIKALRKVIR